MYTCRFLETEALRLRLTWSGKNVHIHPKTLKVSTWGSRPLLLTSLVLINNLTPFATTQIGFCSLWKLLDLFLCCRPAAGRLTPCQLICDFVRTFPEIVPNENESNFGPTRISWNLFFPFSFSGVCSHGRSYQYFAESIVKGNGYQAVYCKTDLDAMNGACTSQADGCMGEKLYYK